MGLVLPLYLVSDTQYPSDTLDISYGQRPGSRFQSGFSWSHCVSTQTDPGSYSSDRLHRRGVVSSSGVALNLIFTFLILYYLPFRQD